MQAQEDGVAGIRRAEVLLPCADLEETLPFFTDRLGFRVETIFPADRPSVAVLSGHGLRLRLARDAGGDPGAIRLECADPRALAGGATELIAPNGTLVRFAPVDAPIALPPLQPAFVHTRDDAEDAWSVGRAGMRYRDLVPARQGGRFIVSHIRIPEGGDVPDYVHHHRIRFQFIYCLRGWVRVVYEDQGPAFVLQPGDCVLQPPGIRHRVLESSAGLEVLEVGSPAEHETHVDHDLTLPTPNANPERSFGGQRFVRHQASSSAWRPCRLGGFEARDTGIAAATGGLAGVQVLRARDPAAPAQPASHTGELLLLYVLAGSLDLRRPGYASEPLGTGACIVIPAGMEYALDEASPGTELLEVTLPASEPGKG